MEKIVEFYPAFDKRDINPSKNYGVCGVRLRMTLKGEKGAVQFVLNTNWHLPHVADETNHRTLMKANSDKLDEFSLKCAYHPMPVDLGYHSPIPLYEGQSVVSESCEYLDGKPCYYDGSTLNAEKIYNVLLHEGSDGVWRELEDFYKKVFSI